MNVLGKLFAGGRSTTLGVDAIARNGLMFHTGSANVRHLSTKPPCARRGLAELWCASAERASL